MVSCAQYCMFISAPGCIFMTYLGLMIAIGSETVYVVPHSRVEGSFALFITAVVYIYMIHNKSYMRYSLLSVIIMNILKYKDNRM